MENQKDYKLQERNLLMKIPVEIEVPNGDFCDGEEFMIGNIKTTDICKYFGICGNCMFFDVHRFFPRDKGGNILSMPLLRKMYAIGLQRHYQIQKRRVRFKK